MTAATVQIIKVIQKNSKLIGNGCFCFLFFFILFVCLCWGLTSQSTIFQSCRDGATASWVINQYFRGVKCLAQRHNTAEVGFEPPTSRSGVRHSTTEPPRSFFFFILIPLNKRRKTQQSVGLVWFLFYGPSTHFRSFRAQSVNLTTLFLGKPPRQFTST